MSDKIILSINFTVNHVDCISMGLVTYDKWDEIKDFLINYTEDISISPYVSDPPHHMYGDTYDANRILKDIKIIDNVYKVKAFKILYGQYFFTGCNFIKDIIAYHDSENQNSE